MTLMALRDNYSWDGDAITPMMYAAPWTIRVDKGDYDRLEAVYKELQAPFGQFGVNTLDADTRALASGSDANDGSYTDMDSQLQTCAGARDALGAQIQSVLEAAETGRRPLDRQEERALVRRAQGLIADVSQLASGSPPAGSVCG